MTYVMKLIISLLLGDRHPQLSVLDADIQTGENFWHRRVKGESLFWCTTTSTASALEIHVTSSNMLYRQCAWSDRTMTCDIDLTCLTPASSGYDLWKHHLRVHAPRFPWFAAAGIRPFKHVRKACDSRADWTKVSVAYGVIQLRCPEAWIECK